MIALLFIAIAGLAFNFILILKIDKNVDREIQKVTDSMRKLELKVNQSNLDLEKRLIMAELLLIKSQSKDGFSFEDTEWFKKQMAIIRERAKDKKVERVDLTFKLSKDVDFTIGFQNRRSQ